MKPETMIYEKARKIIPDKSEKTVFFASVSKTSYEVFFYAFIDGTAVQCYELAEQDELDENALDTAFESIVNIIRDSKAYDDDKYNIVTISIDQSGVKMDVEHYDKDVRMHKIKKEWEQKHIFH